MLSNINFFKIFFVSCPNSGILDLLFNFLFGTFIAHSGTFTFFFPKAILFISLLLAIKREDILFFSAASSNIIFNINYK